MRISNIFSLWLAKDDGCLRIANEILELFLPANPSNIQEGLFDAMEIFLLVLEGVLSTQPEVKPEDIGWQLAFVFVERFMTFFKYKKTFINYYDPVLQFTRSILKILDEEIKVVYSHFGNKYRVIHRWN